MPTPQSKLNLAATHRPVGRNRPHPRRWATPPNPRLNGFLTPNFCRWMALFAVGHAGEASGRRRSYCFVVGGELAGGSTM
ncbi:hypothetical protein FH972_019976 [Carpinus fangiana]|uniref:Uncharacterized protein n=1 Tax=Carpinus fangiana TaxID=176857 RepID=A0A5N6RSB4_9ROSI|nr:hypothetical protein FH972_019976 [Carpinus fangiana]